MCFARGVLNRLRKVRSKTLNTVPVRVQVGYFPLGVRYSELYACLPDYIISKTSRLTAIRNMPATKPRIA